ncbi:MAG: M1 family metallopeptidase [Anaerolineae bacterium]|nr:MAG: M1 family metallopeptidase [Anaerolineae bacterium]
MVRPWYLLAFMFLTACRAQERESTPTPTATPEPTATPALIVTRGFTPTPLPTLEATPPTSLRDLQVEAMLPDFADDARLFPEATRYWIDVRVEFDPGQARGTIDGLSRIQFTNPHDEPLSDIVLMLWPNDPQYRAEVRAGPALIDGKLVPANVELGGLALRYELPEPLGAGETLDLSVPFHITTSGPIGSGNMSRFGITDGVLFAPTFYPLVPRLIEGEWDARTAPIGGDTTVSDVSFYQIRITAPSDLTVVATGVEVDRVPLEDGTLALTYVSGPARDFAFALGPFITQEVEVDGVTVAGWALAEHEEDLGVMVGAAATQLELLADLIGPYPYTELDLVDVPGAFGGIEYPGLVTVGTLGGPNVIDPTVHEVGHQWFYGLIGGDQLEEPWLDEAAATYTQVLYHEEASRRGYATGMLAFFRDQVRDHPNPELPIGLAVDDYDSTVDYALFVYRKGALFFDALRAELGDDLFFEFLQTILERSRYEIASAEDFQATAEDTCGCDLDSLFDLWVFEGGETPGL